MSLLEDGAAIRQVADEDARIAVSCKRPVDIAIRLEGTRDEAAAYGSLGEDLVEHGQVALIAFGDRAASLACPVSITSAGLVDVRPKLFLGPVQVDDLRRLGLHGVAGLPADGPEQHAPGRGPRGLDPR